MFYGLHELWCNMKQVGNWFGTCSSCKESAGYPCIQANYATALCSLMKLGIAVVFRCTSQLTWQRLWLHVTWVTKHKSLVYPDHGSIRTEQFAFCLAIYMPIPNTTEPCVVFHVVMHFCWRCKRCICITSATCMLCSYMKVGLRLHCRQQWLLLDPI